jgi:hypothetical protein
LWQPATVAGGFFVPVFESQNYRRRNVSAARQLPWMAMAAKAFHTFCAWRLPLLSGYFVPLQMALAGGAVAPGSAVVGYHCLMALGQQ